MFVQLNVVALKNVCFVLNSQKDVYKLKIVTQNFSHTKRYAGMRKKASSIKYNHESGIATESSTAAPNDIESSPAAPIPLPFPKIKKHITIVRMNSAALAVLGSLQVTILHNNA